MTRSSSPLDPGPHTPGPLALALRRLRLHHHLSQEALAARAGVDRTYVQKIEKATKHPSFSTVARILDALGVTWAEFGALVDAERANRTHTRVTDITSGDA